MQAFDPLRDVKGAALIADQERWPNFHDAVVHTVRLWRGDIRPQDAIWTGPLVDVTLELAAPERLCAVSLRFHDCSSIALTRFDVDNPISDLILEWRDRGVRSDGRTPLPRHVHVAFLPSSAFSLTLDCFAVEAVGRRDRASLTKSAQAPEGPRP